jgi:hypothetical protein
MGMGKTTQAIGPGSIGNASYNQYYNSPHDQWRMDLGNGQNMDLTWLI